MEPTEREKKLVNYILWLIQMLNGYTLFIAYMYKNGEWLENQLKPLQEKETEKEMLEFLNTEFNTGISMQLDKDYIKERNENK